MITKIRRKKGFTYCARVSQRGKRLASKTFKRRADAEAWEVRRLNEIATARVGNEQMNQEISLRDFATRWLREKVEARLTPSTQAAYRADLENHILPMFGNMVLPQIRPSHGHDLLAHLKAKGLSPKTINGILCVFKSVLKDAVRWQCLERSPLDTVQGLKKLPRPDTYWTEGEVEHFLAASEGHLLYPVFVFALNTGMRRGEICALKWDRVSFARNQIEVTRTIGRFGLREATKNGGKRIVPMNEVVRELLYELRKGPGTEFVFANDDGRPLDAHHLYRDFAKAQADAGNKSKIRFPDLRHTYASNFMMKGGSIYDLQRILGHYSLEMTQRYAHLSPAHLSKAAEVVSFGKKSQQNANDEHQKLQNPPKLREVL